MADDSMGMFLGNLCRRQVWRPPDLAILVAPPLALRRHRAAQSHLWLLGEARGGTSWAWAWAWAQTTVSKSIAMAADKNRAAGDFQAIASKGECCIVLPPFWRNWRLGQRHVLQNTTLTSCYYKNIYRIVVYVYFYESIFEDKSIHIVFTFANLTT
jgi:hypothetical protein